MMKMEILENAPSPVKIHTILFLRFSKLIQCLPSMSVSVCHRENLQQSLSPSILVINQPVAHQILVSYAKRVLFLVRA